MHLTPMVQRIAGETHVTFLLGCYLLSFLSGIRGATESYLFYTGLEEFIKLYWGYNGLAL